jgi:hypothetical protein
MSPAEHALSHFERPALVMFVSLVAGGFAAAALSWLLTYPALLEDHFVRFGIYGAMMLLGAAFFLQQKRERSKRNGNL